MFGALLGGLLMGFPLKAAAQFERSTPPPGLPNATQPVSSGHGSPMDPATAIYTHHMVEFQVAKRFQKVQDDAAKLVALTSQLQQTVAKSPTGTMPSDALREAAQIEKLAKSVNQNTRD